MTLDFNRYHRILDQINPIKVNGTVNEIIGLMVEGHGPASSVGEMCNIFANGGTHRQGSKRDGAGGGGAGGPVMIETDSVHSPLTVHVRGARGGDIDNEYNAHGPGGGGGGGVVILNRAHGGITTLLTGGDPGTHTFSSNEAYGQNRRAARGEDGVVPT